MSDRTVLYALAFCLLGLSTGLLSATAFADDEWEAKKQELDTACEEAREIRLSIDRKAGIEECVESGLRADRAACERHFWGYGQGSPNAGALYYDLPECQRAFEHRNSQRNRDERRQRRNEP